MLGYVGKRLLQSVVTLLVIISIVFLLLRLLPEEGYLGAAADKMTPEQQEIYLTNLGLRDPILVQLGNFYADLVRFDLGKSITYRTDVPVVDILADKIPYSLAFGLAAVAISILIGVPLGILMAQLKGRWLDRLGTGYIVFVVAVPSMVYFLLIQVYITDFFKLPMLYDSDKPISWLLPLISLSLGPIASYAMWMRRYMVDELNKDYIKLAKAKGVKERTLMFSHVMRNAFIPLAQYLPATILFTITGSIYIESLYSIPGMGGLLVDAIQRQDNAVVQGLVLIFSSLGIIGLFLGDIAMALVDPRIKLGRGGECSLMGLYSEEIRNITSKSSEQLFEFAASDENKAELTGYSNYSYWRSTWKSFLKNKVAVFLLILVVGIVFFVLIQPYLPYQKSPTEIYLDEGTGYQVRNMEPNSEFWFGTNSIGQDLWSRIWAGTRTSLLIGVVVALVEVIVGITIGAIWGYSRRLETPISHAYNVIENIPTTIVLILMSLILRPSISTIIIAMCVTGWVEMARFLRNQIVILRDREYNLASRTLGTPSHRIILKNLLPYLVSIIMLRMSLAIPFAIGAEVFLTYIGLGLPISEPSLGNLINEGRVLMMSPDLRYQLIFPSVVLSVITISFYIIGNSFADAADPKNHV